MDLAEVVLKITYLHSGKRHISGNRELLLVSNSHLLTAFYLWQNWKKKILKESEYESTLMTYISYRNIVRIN